MNELECVTNTVLCRLGKGSLLYFPTRQLSHSSPVCLMREPTHDLLHHPPKHIEAQMPETGMPQRQLHGHLRYEAHRLYEAKIEDVWLVGRSLHLGKETSLLAANPQHTIIDRDLAFTLVKLADVDSALTGAIG